MKKIMILGAALITVAAPVRAQDGCANFAWPVDAQRKMLADVTKPTIASGVEFAPAVNVAMVLSQWPAVELAKPPERPPKQASSFAGFVRLGSLPLGRYDVSLSTDAWIDLIQDGAYTRSLASTGRRDCADLRKSVRFIIGSGAVVVQLSDVGTDSAAIVITPVQ